MMTRLILIRHGASYHRDEGIVGGPRGCRGLTAVGRRQAEHLARRLATELSEKSDTIYCSVIPRAVQTAAILAGIGGIRHVVQDCGLCSWHVPEEADGQLWSAYRASSQLPGGGVFRPFQAGNESWSELVGRTGRALEQIAARHREQTTIIVAHAETIRSSMIIFGGVSLAPGFEMEVAPTSITEWVTEGNPEAWPRPRWTLVRFNDSGHLTAMAR